MSFAALSGTISLEVLLPFPSGSSSFFNISGVEDVKVNCGLKPGMGVSGVLCLNLTCLSVHAFPGSTFTGCWRPVHHSSHIIVPG